VDGHPAYAHAVSVLRESGELGRRCRCRSVPYLNNIVEQDHRFIMIKKGQVRWLGKGDVASQVRFIHEVFGIAAWHDAGGVKNAILRAVCICDRSAEPAECPTIDTARLGERSPMLRKLRLPRTGTSGIFMTRWL
jgi:hypothetical protein